MATYISLKNDKEKLEEIPTTEFYRLVHSKKGGFGLLHKHDNFHKDVKFFKKFQ